MAINAIGRAPAPVRGFPSHHFVVVDAESVRLLSASHLHRSILKMEPGNQQASQASQAGLPETARSTHARCIASASG